MTAIELTKPHTHAGRDYAPGAVLDVDDGAARWLIEIGVAKATDPTQETQRKAKE
jgi:hypothetical protein